MQILNVLVMMGFRVAHLYGYDSSAKGEAHHAYSQPMNDQNKKYTFEFQGKYYQAELAMGAQAREFTEIFPKFEKLGLHLEVIGDGLLPDMWRAELDRMRGKSALLSWDDAEREKYTRIWSNPQYRVCSEGEHLVPLFEETCSIKPGDTVLDLGCGCGRASKKLKDAGYGVTAVDIAKNCLDKDVEVPFVEAVLWALPESLTADWAFCCDVMEHIPEEKIDDVLIAINKSCTKGAFFNIAFRESAFEGVLGEKLHLTVRNYHWWIDRLEKHFGDTIHYIEETGVFYSLKKSEEVKLTGLNREICCSGINLDCDLTQ
jgi:SAM-dependent methyltransferase